jgi:hypothetical protein
MEYVFEFSKTMVNGHIRLRGQLFENMSDVEKIAKGKKEKFVMHGIHTVLDMKMVDVSEKSALLVNKGL